jgi:hypothetical protein
VKIKHVKKGLNEEKTNLKVKIKHVSDIQLKIQKIFMLPLDLTIYSLKCKIKEFQKSKGTHIICMY